jgi:hypothetical protein
MEVLSILRVAQETSQTQLVKPSEITLLKPQRHSSPHITLTNEINQYLH